MVLANVFTGIALVLVGGPVALGKDNSDPIAAMVLMHLVSAGIAAGACCLLCVAVASCT